MLEFVIEAMVDAVLVVDAEGRITLANSGATQLTHYSREELRGKFTECAELVLSAAAIEETLDMVEGLEDVSDTTDLVRVVTANRTAAAPV